MPPVRQVAAAIVAGATSAEQRKTEETNHQNECARSPREADAAGNTADGWRSGECLCRQCSTFVATGKHKIAGWLLLIARTHSGLSRKRRHATISSTGRSRFATPCERPSAKRSR